MRRFLTYIAVIVFLFSCKKDDGNNSVNQFDLGKDYYPSTIGHWVEYEVDSIRYNNFTDPITIDTARYCFLELMESTYLDLDGQENIRIEQSKRENDTLPWQIDKIASAKITDLNFQKVESDLRFVKLAFPPTNGKSWDGHIYLNINNEPTLEYLDDSYPWNYQIIEANVSKQIGNFQFDSCVVVEHINEENLFEKKYSQEIYAKGVGLVYKELIILETQAPPSGQSFFERAENGFIIKQTIKDYQQ